VCLGFTCDNVIEVTDNDVVGDDHDVDNVDEDIFQDANESAPSEESREEDILELSVKTTTKMKINNKCNLYSFQINFFITLRIIVFFSCFHPNFPVLAHYGKFLKHKGNDGWSSKCAY